MTAIDLLLLVAIISVAAILGLGGYLLTFGKRFAFSKRYSGTETQTPKSTDIPGVAETTPALDRARAGSVHANWEIARDFSGMEYLTPSTPPAITGYGDCRITAMARDPYWLFAYWEIDETGRNEIVKQGSQQEHDQSRPVLRIYDATELYFFDSKHCSEITIDDHATHWYINTGQPGKTFCIELGRVCPVGSYIFLARSNLVSTPRDQVSEVSDECWQLLPEYASQLYQRVGVSNSWPGSRCPHAGHPNPEVG